MFKYASGSPTPNPASITLTANIQNVTFSKWQYKNSSGVWTDYPTGDGNTVITTTTLVVKPAHAVWVNDVATIRAVTSDAGIETPPACTRSRTARQAQADPNGASASVAMLTNENVTFARNVSGQVSATSVVCNVVAYTGTTKVTPTVGTVTGAPTGMTVARGKCREQRDPHHTLTIAANATLGGAGQQQGTLCANHLARQHHPRHHLVQGQHRGYGRGGRERGGLFRLCAQRRGVPESVGNADPGDLRL